MPGREATHELSTGVKLDRRPCRYASRGVVAKETRNSVKEKPGASSGDRTGGRGAVVVASGGGNVEAAAESDGTRDGGKGGRSRPATSGAEGEDRAAAAAPDDQLAQGWRDPRCRRCALQRKDRADESRSKSTMTVDDDGDGGGEAYAVARLVRRWWQKMGLQREGSRKTGFWFVPFFG
ncbi:hypothetical protein Syun_025222 [Stephania yunnanensis]|uniref:Uncharacterized protein n=1 Tax=Stephania yunnanensis TaxID=152371 RepID=A0AAP0EWM0_9MAGN